MSPRAAGRQGEPAQDLDRDFPHTWPRRRTWYRAHGLRAGTDHGCWYYASLPAGPQTAEGGRFDLPSPRGTCYLASTALAAARERLARPGRIVDHEEVDGAVVTEVRLAPGRVANLLHRDAALHGVTRELSTSVPYSLSQRWAHAFHLAGFTGIVYPPRFSSDAVQALAHFGAAGAPDPNPGINTTRPMRDVLEANGYTVVGPPPTADLGPLLQ